MPRVIKLVYGDDVRRVSLSDEQVDALSLNTLRSFVQQCYGDVLPVEYVLKYKDSDDDWITLATDADLAEARSYLHQLQVLRLTLFPSSTSAVPSPNPGVRSDVPLPPPPVPPHGHHGHPHHHHAPPHGAPPVPPHHPPHHHPPHHAHHAHSEATQPPPPPQHRDAPWGPGVGLPPFLQALFGGSAVPPFPLAGLGEVMQRAQHEHQAWLARRSAEGITTPPTPQEMLRWASETFMPQPQQPQQPQPQQQEPQQAVHHGITCDLCDLCPIRGVRFRATDHDDFDVCEQCHAKPEARAHVYERIERPAAIHWGVQCDGCQQHPLRGVRYHATSTWNFDLCEACYAKPEARVHSFERIDTPRRRRGFFWRNGNRGGGCGGGRRRNNGNGNGQSTAPAGTPQQGTALPTRAAMFVSDVTIPDDTVMEPDTQFTKCWRWINESGAAWPQGTQLVFKSGNLLGGQIATAVVLPPQPGEHADVAVDLVAPSAPGTYEGRYRLVTPEGVSFGQPVWVRIHVAAPSTQHVATPSAPASVDASSSGKETATTAANNNDTTTKNTKTAAVDEWRSTGSGSSDNADGFVQVAAGQSPSRSPKRRADSQGADAGEDEANRPAKRSRDAALDELMVTLEEMGFGDRAQNAELLERYSGRLASVIDALTIKDPLSKKNE